MCPGYINFNLKLSILLNYINLKPKLKKVLHF